MKPPFLFPAALLLLTACTDHPYTLNLYNNTGQPQTATITTSTNPGDSITTTLQWPPNQSIKIQSPSQQSTISLLIDSTNQQYNCSWVLASTPAPPNQSDLSPTYNEQLDTDGHLWSIPPTLSFPAPSPTTPTPYPLPQLSPPYPTGTDFKFPPTPYQTPTLQAIPYHTLNPNR